METHDHQPSVDAAISHKPSPTPTENMTVQAQGSAIGSPEPATQAIPGQSPGEQTPVSPADAVQASSFDPSAQATASDHQGRTVLQSPQAQVPPADAAQTSSFDPSAQAAAPDHQGRTVLQSPQAQVPPADAAQTSSFDPSAQAAAPNQQSRTVLQSPQEAQVPPADTAQAAGQQAQFQPNVIMDPATGQLYYAMPPQGQPVQPPPQNDPYVYYTAQTPPNQEPAPEPHQPDYAQIIKSVEDFAEGDATVADVVKTLWTETAQDDQFWKGAVVGAAAAVLLTTDTVRGAMGKTFGTLFGKNAADAAAGSAPVPEVDPQAK